MIYTIKQKQSGTGNIHDIASEHFDRDIKFSPKAKFAVVFASYYGGRGYTTHSTAELAIAKAKRLPINFSVKIIDSTGMQYLVNYDKLHSTGEMAK